MGFSTNQERDKFVKKLLNYAQIEDLESAHQEMEQLDRRSMMLIMMPGMMLVISYTFPSGLVLYWTVSNVLGIGHQLWVRKRMQAAEAAKS